MIYSTPTRTVNLDISPVGISLTFCLLLVALTVTAGTARAQSFSLPLARNVGSNPNTAAAGDFNGDGKLDVAVGNTIGGSVTIALGNGDGTFASSIEYNTDLNPEGVAVGDFNKDGKLDVAVVNFRGGALNGGSISVLFGNGDGTAQPAVNYDAPGSPMRLVVADLNSDGNLDLVTASNTANKVTVLLGNANGTFNAAVGYTVGTHPQDIAVADFNNDGKLDIATPNTDGSSLSILLGNGDGTFQSATSLPLTGSLSRPYSITTGDLNGDGNPDLVFPSPPSAVGVMLGNGNGTFLPPVAYATTTGEATNARLGDFNGDGKLDVAVINAQSSGATPSVGILRGNGDGTLKAVVNWPTQNSPWGLVVADFNNDGKADVLTTNNGIARINVLLNSPSARGSNFNATVTVQATGVQVASFIDYDTTKTAASFTASVNWGDGTAPTTETVTANGSGGFNVTGTHTYAAAGSYTVKVLIADTDGNFAEASGTANVVKKDQTITFGTLANKTFGDADFTLSATATSNLSVSFSATGNCTVSDSTVHITGAGSCTVTASQAGDTSYNPAPDVQQSFQIAKATTSTALSSSSNPSSIGHSVTFTATVSSTAGTPTGTVIFKDSGTAITNCSNVAVNSGQAVCTTSALSPGGHTITADYSGDSNFSSSTGTLSGGQTVNGGFEFSQDTYTVSERDGSVTITVNRTGDTSQPANVDYSTDDGSIASVAVPCSAVTGLALERCDYTRAAGTLNFAAGETQKTFAVLVNDDSYAEGMETTHLRLSNPFGAQLAQQSSATLQITDDTQQAANPVDDPSFFVRQHYHDFLNREPDASGLQFWTNQMTNCSSPPPADLTICRVNVSAAFFLSIEFQETGYLVERMYKTAFGDTASPNVPGTVPVVRLKEFLPDTQEIGQGVVVGQGNWQQQLEDNKNAFALEFVQRQRFATAFPSSLTADQFVSQLNTNAGGVLTDAGKSQLEDVFGGPSATSADASKRAQVLRAVAENAGLRQAEFNRAFVLMQYFGYLRRNPDDAPDGDFRGWKFWLDKLNQFGGDYVKAEMVKAFITSAEYRQRFGQP